MDKEFHVYVLHSSKIDKIYTGHTNNLERRIIEHNAGLETSTKNKGHWILIHKEKFKTRSEAMKREKDLKTGKGRDFLRKFRPKKTAG